MGKQALEMISFRLNHGLFSQPSLNPLAGQFPLMAVRGLFRLKVASDNARTGLMDFWIPKCASRLNEGCVSQTEPSVYIT